MRSRPAVLFACNLNRVRSPLAAALARHHYGEAMAVDSCGLQPADSVDPFVVAVVSELGEDLSDYEPKDFQSVERQEFDLVVSLTAEAHERVQEVARRRKIGTEYWSIADPTLVEGSREQCIEAYRRTRGELEQRLFERFGPPASLSD